MTREFTIGTGPIPKEFESLQNYSNPERLLGLKGEIICHLFGRWWEILTPEQVRSLLVSWNENEVAPVVIIHE